MRTAADEVRCDFRNENGVAAWWEKDGAWHVARPTGDGSVLWTDEIYRSRVEAISALVRGSK